jgi:hypothetical protein
MLWKSDCNPFLGGAGVTIFLSRRGGDGVNVASGAAVKKYSDC